MTGLAEPRPGGAHASDVHAVVPRIAAVYMWAVIVAAIAVLALRFPTAVPDVWLFLGLVVTSSLASSLRLRLPIGTSLSNLSVSYTIDFAALLLLGRDLTTAVAAASAWTQSTIGATRGPSRRRSPVRLLFSVSALMLTVQAAGAMMERFGGTSSATDLASLAKPMMAGALTYYLVHSALVASAVALSTGRHITEVWEHDFVWTAPGYIVGAGGATLGVLLLNAGHGWVVPLAVVPGYLMFRSYGVYMDRTAADAKHRDEVVRLHRDAVTALDAAQRSEQRYALAAAGSNDGLWDWDIPTGALFCSERWKLMIGLPASTPICTIGTWLDYVHEPDRAGLRAALDAHVADAGSLFEHEYRLRHVDGTLRWVLCRGIAVRDDAGHPVRMAGSQTDVTEWRRVQDSLTRAARHDHLTGLPNRRLFSELLHRSMARGVRAAGPRYAVLFIDLDGFKLVNDSLGHLIGDQFLVAISDRLQAQLRPSDALARLGGDEFAVLIEDFSSPDEVCLVTERLQKSLADPIHLDARELYASASIGVVLGGSQYHTVDDLLRDADIAMYRAKAAGRGGYQIFDPRMHASAVERLTLETELRQAVERRDFTIVYQPIVELPSSEICGLEALVRWTRTDGRVIGPSEFIPVAEETGLIVPLTYAILREACHQGAAWQRTFGQPLGMSVNISSRLFARPDFVDEVERALDASGLLPGTLRLEITESTLLNTSETVHQNFERLRRIKVAMYLDDFGTGYSSLSYLQRYPVDALKLDRSFVARMGSPDHDCVVGNAIVKLAQELGMGLIAEGVETLAHAEQLLALGCPHAQGHLFSEPRTREAVEELLAKAFEGVMVDRPGHSLRSHTRLTA